MKKISRLSYLLIVKVCGLSLITGAVSAQSTLVTIETVQVGDAGNVADSTGYGAIDYQYAIGKYEVTINEYIVFLSAVASITSEGYLVNLWNPSMQSDPVIAGISRGGSGTLADPYTYSVIGSGNRPIAYVSWFDAARFCNWLNNGATLNASTEDGAYTLNGATSGMGFNRNVSATWWIPSEDEWYKAAYYKGGSTNAGYWLYPTQSDTAPGNNIGSQTNQANYYAGTFSTTQAPGPYDPNSNYLTDAGAFSASSTAYGSFDQAGNLSEWNDAAFTDSTRGLRDAAWLSDQVALQSLFRNGNEPDEEISVVGFRVATVPEPSTYALLLFSGAASLWALKRHKS